MKNNTSLLHFHKRGAKRNNKRENGFISHLRRVYSFPLLCLYLFATLSTISLPVLANGPGVPMPENVFEVSVINFYGEKPAGVDLLLPEAEIPPEDLLPQGSGDFGDYDLPADCMLATYNVDGYVSYLARFKGASHDMLQIYEYGLGNGGDGAEQPARQEKYRLYVYIGETGYDEIREMSSLILAIFDAEGNVRQVSDPFTPGHFSTTKIKYVQITYNAESNETEIYFVTRGDWYLMLIFLAPLTVFIAMWLTVLIEVVIGLIFRMKPLRIIFLTTGISNLIMNILLIYLHSVKELPWIPVVIVLELLVLIAEFLIYKKKYRDRSTVRILIYTIIANALSFFLVEMIMSAIWVVR